MITADIDIIEDQIKGERADVPLDGLSFQMLTSSTSAVDGAEPTVFRYFEREGVTWGDYVGDTVVEGRFAGIRNGDVVRLSYNHRSTSGALTHGNAITVISRMPEGQLRLTEFYRNAQGDPALSICEEAA